MKLSSCGINFKCSSLHEREPLQINRGELAQAVKVCGEIEGVLEAAVLTTCNRIEFYLVLDNSTVVFDAVKAFYLQYKGIDIEPLRKSFRTYQGSSVARHLFKVTSGMESMVIGETQIQGQVKEAYRFACSVKCAGKVLHKLFHFAFRAGKRIRTDTEIGQGAVSISSAALEMIAGVLNQNTEVVCIGISPMIEMTINSLLSKGLKNITLANRTLYKAEKAANRYGIEFIDLNRLLDKLQTADIVISATGSDSYVLDADIGSEFLKKRGGKSITFIDMALPRDIDPQFRNIQGVKILDLEDIKYHTSKNKHSRGEALQKASEIAEAFVSEFMAWQKNSALEPLIKELFEEMENIRRRELDEAKRKVPVEQWDELERLSNALMKKAVDLPVRQLKELNESSQSTAPVEIFRELFKLKSSPEALD